MCHYLPTGKNDDEGWAVMLSPVEAQWEGLTLDEL